LKTHIFILKTFYSTPLQTYRYPGFNCDFKWPKEGGVGLGVAGIWNLLLRVGEPADIVEEENLHTPRSGDLLFVNPDNPFSPDTEKKLYDWMEAGGKIVGAGCPEAWRFAFPSDFIIESSKLDNPYSALAWICEGAQPELITPPGWKFLKIKKCKNISIKNFGILASIGGERQTPQRALVSPIEEAPAVLTYKNFIFFNGNPFSAFQAWLQGQENLEPWLLWRHRIFWLDEYASFLCQTLKKIKIIQPLEKGIPALAKTTIVLKHDLDYSRDSTYLDIEKQANISGVHAILKDSNTNYWLDKLKLNPQNESAFHYNTAIYSRWLEAARHILLNLPKRSYLPNKKAIQGKGLLKQVRWAKKKGIGINTLHRHDPFIIYPELVDALDTVYNNEIEVLGSNSFFRGQVLRWGVNCSDGLRGNYGDAPNPQFPYWFPFRLAHSGYGGRLLKGWETTSMMEIEPGLLEQMIDYNIPGLSQKVIVLNFHPAHARTSTFVKGGCVNWFHEILNLCHSRKVDIRTLSDVFKVLKGFVK
tara:strand:+ start:6926 stop:8515 length:1590 start_codon:yes stop_codon:yes gene_type:complete